MKRPFLILGANNPELVRLYERCKERDPEIDLLGFLDNDPEKRGKEFFGFPIFGGHETLDEPRFRGVGVLNAITRDARVRHETTRQILQHGAHLVSLIHPSVDVGRVRLGSGLYLQEGVVVQAGCVLEDNVSIHIGTVVGHETRIGHSSFIAHGGAISGCCDIGSRVFVGVGANILPRVRIGDGAVVGGGAVVLKDVESNTVVVGNPAKMLKRLDP